MNKKSFLISIAILVAGLLFASYSSTPIGTVSNETVMLDSSYAEVYPTTFKNEVFIKGFSEEENEVRVEVFNFSGILVRTFVLENELSLSPFALDMTGLENEGFVIRVYENNVLISKHRAIKNE